ncbi:MAG: molybdopterin-dependent oxidoreductase [Actinomycetota bacterium]
MPRLRLPEDPPRLWPRIPDGVRSIAITARVGRLLGIAFGICFVTGLISRYQYVPWSWLPIPSAPVWGYRLTQGLHVITGIASIPLLLVKLWSVFPKLFEWPPARSALHALERLSIAVLISSALLEVVTGFMNILNWYPWPWSFIDVHRWLAWVIAGSILLHIAAKLPLIRRGLAEPVPGPDAGEPPAGISRRGVLIAAGAGVGIVTVTTAGQAFTPIESLGLLAARRPHEGPQNVPINRTAAQAGVKSTTAHAASYRLQVVGPTPFELDLAALEALPGVSRDFPIACVEGWSAGASWTGPRLLDLVRRAGGDGDSTVRLTSLEPAGPYRRSAISGPELRAALLATHLNGERITLDHGYPARLIAPNRAGVFNTKWLTKIEVVR